MLPLRRRRLRLVLTGTSIPLYPYLVNFIQENILQKYTSDEGPDGGVQCMVVTVTLLDTNVLPPLTDTSRRSDLQQKQFNPVTALC